MSHSRRTFLQGLGAAAALGPAAAHGAARFLSPSAASLAAAARRNRQITLLPDGGFEEGAWGWQFTTGAAIVPAGAADTPHSGRHCLRVHAASGDYARFLVLTPRWGAKYTLSGWWRCAEVVGAGDVGEPAGMYYSASQYEFQGRPVDEARWGHVQGTQGWQRFSHTFTCLPTTTWFEVVVGVYRASGTAWFDDLTFVESETGAELADTVAPEEAARWAHESGLQRASRQKPRAAVLRDRLPVFGAASAPERLAELLAASHDCEYLDAHALADPQRLNRQFFDMVVLPYGESFPAAAQASLEAFLADGGDFISTGGYAFQSPLLEENGAWRKADEVARTVPGRDLLAGVGFDAGWQRPAQGASDPAGGRGGVPAARVTLPAQGWGESAAWSHDVAAAGEGRQFWFEADLRCADVDASQEGYAFIGVEQLDAAGDPAYAAPLEFLRLTGTQDWQHIARLFVLTPDARTLRIRFGLQRASGALWVSGLRLEARGTEIRINTARGFPQDELRITPQQIGVFDADYRLERVAALRPAPQQVLLPSSAGELAGAFTGYAAAGVLGMNNARWIPLLNARDRLGRSRGAAAAMMHLHHGPYTRSSWAFFGVDNQDLFAPENALPAATLRAVGHALARKCYLHELETDLACYRAGEGVRVRVRASNYGREQRNLQVRVTIHPPAPAAAAVFTQSFPVPLAAGETRAVLAAWKPASFAATQYRVTAQLRDGDELLDQDESGFDVWDAAVLRSGMPVEFHDNYFHVGERPVFLQGTDDYLHTFLARNENPLTWQADAEGCRDTCIDVYENLMGLRGPQQNPTEAWWRWIDAMLLNVQRAGGVFFPGMLIFSNTAVSNRDLADQQHYVRQFAERYREAAGLMYYLNGDLEFHDPNLPDLRALYQQYLRRTYGTDAQLRAAWTLTPPEAAIGNLPVRRGSDDWRDVRTFDDFAFRVELVRRWLNGLHDAIREVDTRHPVTAEFYQTAAEGIDLVTAIGKLELANFGYFNTIHEDVDRFPQTLKFLDLSLRGKGINVGEFGVKTHPAWDDVGYYIQARSQAYEQNYFLTIGHYGFGLGASKIQNWCWKNPADLPFAWGINYPCDLTPRDVRFYYRNNGVLFRRFQPRYVPADVVVVLPGNNRMGGQGAKVREGLLNGIRLLLDARVHFATLEDEFLADLPATTRAVFYPLPYCPSDAVVARLEAFVRAGGTLYLSGDISYDPLRQRTATARLQTLCGVEFVAERYPNIAFEHSPAAIQPAPGTAWPAYEGAPGIRVRAAGATVLATTAAGDPVWVEHRLGAGRVLFSTDPIELHAAALASPVGHTVYAAVLGRMGISGEAAEPADAGLHVMRVPTRNGETVRVLVNHHAEPRPLRLPSQRGAVEVLLAAQRTGVVATDAEDEVTALETAGPVHQGSTLLLDTDLHCIALPADQRPLRHSRRWVLLPMGEGTVRIPDAARWHDPMVWVGEVVDGRWRRGEAFRPLRRDGELLITVDADRNLSMLLCAEHSEESIMARTIEQWVREPWRS